ncbi:hypothetical protein NQ315_015151 [Exocentrus adspersus]|uniref:Malate dehydrogenase, mitochondrial n=1 Tax=Exocentrus adspersus TaxID=1586481 RepID=A0AAV8VEK0_9CUCU|nr:hypothetical protein NQ315_015151 [Exocentrus adspersus]
MLKQCPLIDELCMHDVKLTSGFTMELNHVDTNCKVTGFTGKENLPQALEHSKVVVIAAAAPETSLLSFDKMWIPNAQILREMITHISKCCPKILKKILKIGSVWVHDFNSNRVK